MKLLGLETSSARGSVAVIVGEAILERPIATPREQTEKLVPLIDELLGEAGLALGDLDGIAFGRGPGSFTGLRVAAAIAQGFAWSSGVPLLPVSSLAALAQGVWRADGVERALLCIDARMGEVYYAEYAIVAGLPQALQQERLSVPADVQRPATGAPWTAVGDGFAVYAEALAPVAADAERVFAEPLPQARDLFPLAAADLAAGRTTPIDAALPVYLRDATAWHR